MPYEGMYGRSEAACLGEAYGGDRLTARNLSVANEHQLASATADPDGVPSLTFQPGASVAGCSDPLAGLTAGGGLRRGSGGLGDSRGSQPPQQSASLLGEFLSGRGMGATRH